MTGKRSAPFQPSRVKPLPTSSAFPSWRLARNRTSTSRRHSSALQATSRSASSTPSNRSSNNSPPSTSTVVSQLAARARTAVKKESKHCRHNNPHTQALQYCPGSKTASDDEQQCTILPAGLPFKQTLLEGRTGAIHKYLLLHQATTVTAYPGRYLMGFFFLFLLPCRALLHISSRARYIGWALLIICCTQHPIHFDSGVERPGFLKRAGSGSLSSFRGSSCLVTLFHCTDLTYTILPNLHVSHPQATEIGIETAVAEAKVRHFPGRSRSTHMQMIFAV